MRVTVEELLEAAQRNGFVHVRNHWFKTDDWNDYGSGDTTVGRKDAPITQACFMGQMAINLGVEGHSLHKALNEHFSGLGSDIISWNDSYGLAYADILAKMKERIKYWSDLYPSDTPTKFNLRKAKYYAKRKDE